MSETRTAQRPWRYVNAPAPPVAATEVWRALAAALLVASSGAALLLPATACADTSKATGGSQTNAASSYVQQNKRAAPAGRRRSSLRAGDVDLRKKSAPQGRSAQTANRAAKKDQTATTAATTPARTTTLNTITVVGKTGAKPFQAVPDSVAVVTSHRMAELHVKRLSDLSHYVSNVFVANSNDPDTTAVIIRGVGNGSNSVGFTDRVGVYVDGVYVGQSPALNQSMLGIKQVEVFRGPQGTQFGKNTEAGAINIITTRPSHHFEGAFNFGVGNYNLKTARLHLSGPLANEVYGGITLGRTYRKGFLEDVTNGDTLANENNRALRAQLEVDRVANLKIYATADYMRSTDRSEADGRAISNPTGTAPPVVKTGFYQVGNNHTPTDPLELWGGAVTVSYSFPNESKLKSISSYRDTRYRTSFDIDYSPLDLAYSNYQFRYKQFTQEFQYLSPAQQAFHYTLGLYLYRLDAMQRQTISFGALAPLVGIPDGAVAPLFATDRTTSAAGYANLSYDVGSHWNLEGGVRYTHGRQTAFYTVDTSVAPQFDLATGVYQHVLPENTTTPTAIVTYKFNKHNRVYARYAKGYKSGGFNVNFVSAAIFPNNLTFGSEHSDDYEVGYKGELAGGHVHLSADGFWTTYHGYQTSRYILLNGSVQQITANAASVRTRGAEFSIRALLAPGLTLSDSAGYLDAYVINYPDATSTGQNFAGKQLPFAPRFTNSLGLSFTHSLSPELYGNLAMQYSYRTHYFSNVVNQRFAAIGTSLVPYGYTAGYGLLDASFTLSNFDREWQVGVWARNLTGKHYVMEYHQDFFGTFVANPGTARMFGLDATVRF